MNSSPFNLLFSGLEELQMPEIEKKISFNDLVNDIKNNGNEFFSCKKSIDNIEQRLEMYLPDIESRLLNIHSVKRKDAIRQVVYFYLKDLISNSYYYFHFLDSVYDQAKHRLRILEAPKSPPIIGIHGDLDFQYNHVYPWGVEFFVGEYFRLFYPGVCEEVPLRKYQSPVAPQVLPQKFIQKISPLRIASFFYRIYAKTFRKKITIIVANAQTSIIKKLKLLFYSTGKAFVIDSVDQEYLQFNALGSEKIYNLELRGEISKPFSKNPDKFELFLCKCLEASFPWTLLEGFTDSMRLYKSYWAKYPNLKTLVSEVQYQGSGIALGAALELGIDLVVMPHFFPLEINYAHRLNHLLLDQYPMVRRGKFCSRGGRSLFSGGVYEYKIRKRKKTIPILYVSTDFYINFLPHEYSTDGSGYGVYLSYLRFVDDLFLRLSRDTKKNIYIKMRADHICKPLNLTYPNACKTLDKNISVRNYIGASRLVLVEGLSTSFFESMASGIPVISFWPDIYTKNPDYIDYWKPLLAAGIIFNDAGMLSRQVESVKNDPLGWWNSYEIQHALKEFSEMHFNLGSKFEKSIFHYVRH